MLTLTVTARANDKTVFLVEASQAGVFAIRGVPPNQLQPVLAIHCPAVLFPYARETSPMRRCARDFRRCISRRSISKRCTSSSLRKRRPKRLRSPTDARAVRDSRVDDGPPRCRALLIAARRGRSPQPPPISARPSDPAAVLYDAPSARARPLFIYGRDVPVETLVSVEGWTKIRDAAGTIGWMQAKSLSDKRMVVVPCAGRRRARSGRGGRAGRVSRRARRAARARGDGGVAAATATPGWLKVRHRDGQTGYVRLSQVFGF